MKNCLWLVLMLLVGCQRTILQDDPIVYGFMPDSMVVMDSLLTTIPEPPDLKKFDNFKTISINEGSAVTCTDDECDSVTTVNLPAGLVISDRTGYELAYNRIAVDNANKRFVIANELFTEYNKQVETAEKLYDRRIKYLEKKSERSWMESNSVYIGFLAGIVTTIAIQYAVIEVAK